LIIACWKYKIRDQSLRHFQKHGFETIGCGYYDSKNLENAAGWLESLHETPGTCGIMYTTWQNQYDLLETFGDLCSE
jgi:hypothetical protein